MIVPAEALKNESAGRQFISDCESSFRRRLDAACEALAGSGARILTLTGPTCSGKTTAAGLLSQRLSGLGQNLHVISLDDYYFDRPYLESLFQDGEPDYDSYRTIDLDELARTIASILGDGEVVLPVFDFVQGRRIGEKRLQNKAEDVFLFEGIQGLYPQVRRLLPADACRRLFISVEEDLLIGETKFSSRDIRLLRRLVRDDRTRGIPPQRNLAVWPGVVHNEDQNIFPYADACDIRINSLLGYDPLVIKPYLQPLLAAIPKSDPFWPEGDALLSRLISLPSLPADAVPPDSLFREFIGT